MAKIMRKKNFKMKMLAGNRLKIHVGANSEISTTLFTQLTNGKIIHTNFCSFIGIHVRLTDYHHHLEVLYNAEILKPRFYEKAIDYFKAKYEKPLFIVLSDDEEEASELGNSQFKFFS